MATLEIGIFIAFMLIPFLSFIFLGRLKSMGFAGFLIFLGLGIMGFMMLGALSLIMFSQYDIVQSEVEVFADENGTTAGTVTHTTPIINAFHNEIGWLFVAMMSIFGIAYLRVLI